MKNVYAHLNPLTLHTAVKRDRRGLYPVAGIYYHALHIYATEPTRQVAAHQPQLSRTRQHNSFEFI